ncbi:MAG TPA: hypothetical protein VGB27_04885 [Candidatus Binatia bacterium]
MSALRKVIQWPTLLLILPLAGYSVLDAVAKDPKWDERVLEMILKGLGILLSAVSSIWLVPKLKQSTKAGLKTDLEILKLMKDTEHPLQNVVQDQVSAAARAIYTREVGRFGLLPAIKNRTVFILGIVCLPLFLIWTVRLYPNGWMFLTGFLALASFGWILIGFEEPRKNEDTKGKA